MLYSVVMKILNKDYAWQMRNNAGSHSQMPHITGAMVYAIKLVEALGCSLVQRLHVACQPAP